jgi:hypothetical protein
MSKKERQQEPFKPRSESDDDNRFDYF